MDKEKTRKNWLILHIKGVACFRNLRLVKQYNLARGGKSIHIIDKDMAFIKQKKKDLVITQLQPLFYLSFFVPCTHPSKIKAKTA